MMQMTTQWIATDGDLQSCCSQLEAATYIALDTEFERVRTYYPRLCLLQLATEQGIWLLDPMHLDKLVLIKSALSHADALIIHAARQDLEVLNYALDLLPATLFDTQVAAAFLGLGDQVGYATLVQQTQGLELEKSQTRTNWCQRPLTAAQLQYAADDVRYLGPLYQQLQQQLEQQGKSTWMQEEMCDILGQHIWQPDPPSIARRLLGKRSRLDPNAQERFVMLVVWREKVAMQRNLPREWVLGNDLLRQIAELNPTSMEQLQRLKTLSSKMLDRYGKFIIQTVSTPTPENKTHKDQTIADDRTLLRKLRNVTTQVALKNHISPGLLASRKTLLELLEGDNDCPLLHGWRQRLLGEQLLDIIATHPQNHTTTAS